jgi:hypothetical protein
MKINKEQKTKEKKSFFDSEKKVLFAFKNQSLLVITLLFLVIFSSLSLAVGFNFNGNHLFLNGTNGNIGIGTTAPSQKLEIKGGHTTTKLRMYADNGVNPPAYLSLWASEPGVLYNGAGIGNNVNGSPYYGRINISYGSSYIRFLTNGIRFNVVSSTGIVYDALSVSDVGNVGIGTTSPTQKLHVSGNVVVDGKITAGDEIILKTLATKGSCAAGNTGALVFDTTHGKPYVCNGIVWKPLDSDYDSDGITDAIDTNDNNAADATAIAGDVRSGKTLYAGGAAITGTLADCSGTSGVTGCYVASGERHDNECADSTTTTTTECYVDDTAKYVGSNACAADSNTGYCYMNSATLSAKDTTLAAGNIKNGENIFGITGTYTGGTPIWVNKPTNEACTTTCSSYGGTVASVAGTCIHYQNWDGVYAAVVCWGTQGNVRCLCKGA